MEIVLRTKFREDNYELSIDPQEEGLNFCVLKDGDKLFQLDFSVDTDEWILLKELIDKRLKLNLNA